MSNVGISIIEGVAAGADTLQNLSKRNIGLLGQFVRGASLKPTKISTLEDFNVIFGGYSPDFYGPRIVKAIFENKGDAPATLYISRVTGSGSVAATKSTTLSGAVTMTATAGYKGSVDTGAWANGIIVKLYSYSSVSKDNFTLEVIYGSNKETYNGTSLASIQDSVNRVSKYVTISFSGEIEKITYTNLTGTISTTSGSNVLTGVGTQFTTELAVGNVVYSSEGKLLGTILSVTSATAAVLTTKAINVVTSASAKKRADSVYSVTLESGVDGEVVEGDFYAVESATDPKGLECFTNEDVQIIGVTEYHTLSMAKKLNEYLNRVKLPVGVINLPLNADEGTAELYAIELQTSGVSYLIGAYEGWVKVYDDAQGSSPNVITIPALGHILGAAYLRTPYLQGDFIHIPPGGVDSALSEVIEVIQGRFTSTVKNRLVREFSCNILEYSSSVGYYVGSSRTYSTDAKYHSAHIRMQTSYYRRALVEKLRFTVQKPNTPELKSQVLTELRRFFKTEYDNGALERSVPFNTSYKGICDSSNNPATQDRKQLNVDVLWIPTECVESTQISLQRNDQTLLTTEI